LVEVVRIIEIVQDLASCGRAAEEYWTRIVLPPVLRRHVWVVKLEKDAFEREREEVRAVVVHGGAPRLAHAAGHGEAGRREAAEDVQQHVFREYPCQVHVDGSSMNRSF
jgi:hypothetical protein